MFLRSKCNKKYTMQQPTSCSDVLLFRSRVRLLIALLVVAVAAVLLSIGVMAARLVSALLAKPQSNLGNYNNSAYS